MARILDYALRGGLPDGPRIEARIHRALELAVNGGKPITTSRGDVTLVEAPELPRLPALSLSLSTERRNELRRYRETAEDFEESLTRAVTSAALVELVDRLEDDPGLDPRNPRNAFHLRDAARDLLARNDVERSAIARGENLTTTAEPLEEVYEIEVADAFRARYLRVERALRELREWLTRVVRNVGDEVVSAEERAELEALARVQTETFTSAESWAETLEGYTQSIASVLAARQRVIRDVAAEIEALGRKTVIVQSSATDRVSTRANLYVGLDLGMLYAPDLARAAAYFGANIYFRPVNKNASLRDKGSLGRRLSLTVGIAFTDLKVDEEETKIDPLLGARSNIVLGAGFRLAKSVRIGGGILLFLENDPNPLRM